MSSSRLKARPPSGTFLGRHGAMEICRRRRFAFSGASCSLLLVGVVLTCHLLCHRLVYASDVRPHSATITASGLSDFLYLSRSAGVDGGPEFEKLPTISLTGRIYGLGRVDVVLTTKRNLFNSMDAQSSNVALKEQKTPILMQGSIAFGGGLKRIGSARVKPVAASIVGNQLVLSFSSRKKGRAGRERLYQIRAYLSGNDTLHALVKVIPGAASKLGGCASSVEDVLGKRGPEAHAVGRISASGTFRAKAVTRIITLSTDADVDWYSRYGSESLARIAQIVNTAEALYYHEIGIGFSIHKQHIYTSGSPYSSSDPGTLLNQFVRNAENPINLALTPELYESAVDAKHLFTGKELDGSVVGIAYLSSICRYPVLSFGLTQDSLDVVTPAIFAHELAHNLGAFHDMKNPGTLMYPSLVVGTTLSFSQASRDEMEGHIAQSPACLDPEERESTPTPTPMPTEPPKEVVPEDPGSGDSFDDREQVLSLKIKILERRSTRRALAIRGQLVDQAGVSVVGRAIQLMRNRETLGVKLSDNKGRVTFVVPRRNTKDISLRTEDGHAVSRTIGTARNGG
jgi:hypothetical protein